MSPITRYLCMWLIYNNPQVLMHEQIAIFFDSKSFRTAINVQVRHTTASIYHIGDAHRCTAIVYLGVDSVHFQPFLATLNQ